MTPENSKPSHRARNSTLVLIVSAVLVSAVYYYSMPPSGNGPASTTVSYSSTPTCHTQFFDQCLDGDKFNSTEGQGVLTIQGVVVSVVTDSQTGTMTFRFASNLFANINSIPVPSNQVKGQPKIGSVASVSFGTIYTIVNVYKMDPQTRAWVPASPYTYSCTRSDAESNQFFPHPFNGLCGPYSWQIGEPKSVTFLP